MAQLTLDCSRTVPVLPFSVDVHRPAPRPDGSAPVTFRADTEAAVSLAAARADVVRLGFSAEVPTIAAMRRLVRELEAEIAAVGRDRSGVRVVLDIEVVLVDDDAAAERKRTHLDSLDALAGLTWVPSETRVVAAPRLIVARSVALGRDVGADGVVLVPLGGAGIANRLRVLAVESHLAPTQRSVA
jgi:alkanesulfonate monooxygenase SsuD/methylene tetrahydromethanopterin reductase-like flavin-dependent oxidoreductase (luciferase family)